MNVFVTGGSGFLGKNLIKELIEQNDIDMIYCLEHNSRIDIISEKIVRIHGSAQDVSDIKLAQAIDKMIVITGVTNGRGASIEDTFKINRDGTKKAVEFCIRNDVKDIIFVSSINVILKKKGAYAKSKISAETLIEQSGLNYTIFRPALIYGYNQSKGLGVIESCIRKYGVVPVFGNGKKLEQPVHVKECSQIMAQYIIQKQSNRIIYVAGNETFTYNDLCREIGRIIGRKTRLMHLPAKPFEIVLSLMEKLRIGVPVSVEQIYHIDSNLDCDMENVYKELEFKPGKFKDLYQMPIN